MTKRAVCVGVNRFSDATIPPLQGCVNDVKHLSSVLSSHAGFDPSDVKTLTDAQATKANVLRAIEWLTISAAPGDTLLLYFATYGSQWPSPSGQDRDGLDEIVLVHDHSWQFTCLTDDEIVAKLRRAPSGTSVVCILDTAPVGPPEPPRQPGQMGPIPPAVLGRFLAPPGDSPSILQSRQRGLTLHSRIRRQEGDETFVVVLASDGDEPVLETLSAGGASGMGGAFTHALVEELQAGGGSKRWEDVIAEVTRLLRGKGQRQSPRALIPDTLRGSPALASPSSTAGGAGQNSPAMGAQMVPAPGGAYPISVPSGGPSGGGIPAPSQAGIMAPIPAPMPAMGDLATSAGSGGPGLMGVMTGAAVGIGGVLAAGAAAVGLGARSSMGGSSGQPGSMTGASASSFSSVLAPLGPDASSVDRMLHEFPPDAITVRVCNAAMGVVPFAPKITHYTTIDDAVRTLYPQATSPMLARVHELASGESVAAAIKTVDMVDMADGGISLFSGVKSAYGLITGGGLASLETDTQQGVDAALKLLALSYFIHRLFPGSIQEKIQLFHTTPGGQILSIYYASVEIALPFADNLASGAGSLVQRVFSSHGAAAISKLGGLIGAENAGHAQGVLGGLIGPMDQTVSAIAPHARNITSTMGRFFGGAMNVMDKAAGVVATAADALPVYRYLGARVAAESCVLLASKGM